MKDIYKDLIYLLSCAVNGITPDTARVQAMDLEPLYRLAKFHTVRAAVCIALKRAGIEDKAFYQAYTMLLQQFYRPADMLKMAKTLELVDRLADSVKLYRFGCNMDISAAKIAYEGMK